MIFHDLFDISFHFYLFEMDYRKKYKEIVDGIDHESFDSLMAAFENILDILENIPDKEKDQDFIEEMITKASEVKQESAKLLMKEREEIVSVAKNCGISLSELGINCDSDDEL